MKYNNLASFRRHLSEAAPDHLSPVYLLVSKDAWTLRTALDLVRGKLPGERQAWLRYEAPQVSRESLLTSLSSPSFFSPFTTVFVAHADKLHKETMETLVAYMDKPVAKSFLVLSAESLHKGTRFYKAIERVGVVVEVAELKPWEKEKTLSDWIVRKAVRAGKTMTMAAAGHLVQRVGSDGMVLEREWEKLLCFVDDEQSITENEIEEICEAHPAQTIWQVGEALFSGEGGRACAMGRRLLMEGESLLGLLRQLRSQWQTRLHIASVLEAEGSPIEITQDIPYLRGQILERTVDQARRYGKRRLVQGLLALDEAELLRKNGVDDEPALLDTVLAKLVF